MSIHLHSCIGMVCCCPNEYSRLRCCFCLWPGCNHTWACLWNLLFLWICRNFCVILNWIDHVFDRSIGNSDPRMRIVLIHGLKSNFNSKIEVLETGRDFLYRSNPHISLNPSFSLWSRIISSKSVFTTSYWAKLSKINSVFGHEINFNNMHKSCFLTEFIHFVFWWKRFNLLNVLLPYSLVIHGIFVVQRSFCFDFAKNNWPIRISGSLDLSWWPSNSSQTDATAQQYCPRFLVDCSRKNTTSSQNLVLQMTSAQCRLFCHRRCH